MSRRRKLDPFLVWLCFIFGSFACGLDISFEHQSDGFFLQDFYSKNDIPDPNTVTKTFIVNQPSNLYKVKAEYGLYESHQTLSRSALDTVYSRSRSNNSLMHRTVAYNLDVSVHIVSREISPKIPTLQVLFHTIPLEKQQDGQWCAQVFANANNEEISSTCLITYNEPVCVASIVLHKEWWTVNATSVKVSYSFSTVSGNSQCARASNSVIPNRSLDNKTDEGVVKLVMTTLQLATNQESFDEWKDQDILIDVPREVYHQGDTFEIPIRLEGNSDLQTFVMRARVRQGLHITGARLTDSSNQWNIHVDIKEHQKTGTVTVYVRDSKLYKKLKDVQEVFRWQMEVAEDTYDSKDLGRVIWSIEYQQDRAAHEHFPLTTGDSKVVSQINIRSKDQQRLVPVLKVWEILNVAVLTGTSQQYPLKIYAVNSLDRLQDVTAQTKCHSVEVDVLKVSMDCSSVYVDGAENRGSHNVTIIAKYGQTTAFFDVTVWVPEERLDIQLSDRKLSRVKNWKSADSTPRKSKSSEASLKPYESNGQAGVRCELVHQQALVQVYTRFYIQTPKQTEYFMGPGAYFQVTNLVKGLLRMSDPGVAVLTADNIIRGREEGRTEIQLQSAKNGHLLAATEVIVSHDKVSVVQLGVRLVTGMTMFVEPSSLLPGALTATAHIDSQLLSEHHLGMLAVEVVYSDLTSMPVELLPTDLFHLEVHTENSSIVDIALNDGPANLPQVVARGEGRGELLKVSLHGSEECARRESRPLITSPMFIDLDFSREARTYSQHHPYQMDAHYDTNRASDRWEDAAKQQPVFSIKPQSQAKNAVLKGKFEDVSKDKDYDDIQMVKNALGELVDEHPEAQQEPLRTKTVREGLTPLEIGMYVLLAVFCVAITVFMINCVVFFVRYKRKQKPRKTGSTDAIKDANDWVWIGRATLERNSVYTDSSRALMPEEDFNGNLSERSERPLSVGSNSSTSSRSNSSNRNSVVSTYRGSECSIRITANPLTEEGAMSRLPEETQSQMGIPQWDYEEMGMNYDELLKYFDNLKESNA